MSNSNIPNRIFIQQFEDPKIEGFQADDGATWWTSQVNEHDIEYINIKEYKKLEAKVKDLEKELSSERSSRDADCMVSDMYKDHNDQLEKELAELKEARTVRADHVTDASKKVERRCKTCNFKSDFDNHFRGDFCLDCFFGEISKLEEKVSQLTDENDRLKKFAINLEFQTNTRMQNFMVQSVYDRINKDCREVLLSKQIQEGE